ncbi:hypothetical protein Ahia01_000478100, partial [Argonauta hians]
LSLLTISLALSLSLSLPHSLSSLSAPLFNPSLLILLPFLYVCLSVYLSLCISLSVSLLSHFPPHSSLYHSTSPPNYPSSTTPPPTPCFTVKLQTHISFTVLSPQCSLNSAIWTGQVTAVCLVFGNSSIWLLHLVVHQHDHSHCSETLTHNTYRDTSCVFQPMWLWSCWWCTSTTTATALKH